MKDSSNPTEKPAEQLLHVLVVEDSTMIREMLIMVLSRPDTLIHAEGVGTLAECLTRLADPAQPAISVVLLDILLPDADGLIGVEKIQEQALNVPIVVLTGLKSTDLETAVREAGVEGYFEKKNLDYAALIGALRRTAIRHAVKQQFAPLQEKVERASKVVEELKSISKEAEKKTRS